MARATIVDRKATAADVTAHAAAIRYSPAAWVSVASACARSTNEGSLAARMTR